MSITAIGVVGLAGLAGLVYYLCMMCACRRRGNANGTPSKTECKAPAGGAPSMPTYNPFYSNARYTPAAAECKVPLMDALAYNKHTHFKNAQATYRFA